MNFKTIAKLILATIPLALNGCQSKPIQEPPHTAETQQPAERVINQGMGMSFEMKKEEIEKLGFQLEPMELSKRVSKWSTNNRNITKEWQKKSVTLTPISGMVQEFSSQKIYLHDGTTDLKCEADYLLLTEKIKNQYQSLRDVTYLRNSPGKFLSARLCEGEKKPSPYDKLIGLGSTGLGRCISIMCLDISSANSTPKVNSLLEVQYTDQDLSSILKEEERSFMTENRENILQKRGIDPSQF